MEKISFGRILSGWFIRLIRRHLKTDMIVKNAD